MFIRYYMRSDVSSRFKISYNTMVCYLSQKDKHVSHDNDDELVSHGITK